MANGKNWSKSEDNILKKYFGKIPDYELESKFTLRTTNAIMTRVSILKLVRKVDWTPAEDQYLFDNSNLTTREMSNFLKKNYRSISDRKKVLGVPPRKKSFNGIKSNKSSPTGYMVKATYSLKEDVNNPYIAVPTKYTRTMRYPTELTVESATSRALDSMTNHQKVVNIEIKEVVPL